MSPGYACAPYLHTHGSVELKESWMSSGDVEGLYFATGTFSPEIRRYFADTANHYLLAKFSDAGAAREFLGRSCQAKTSFVFGVRTGLFYREVRGGTNSVSVYYVEYAPDPADVQEIANLTVRREKVSAASLCTMSTFSPEPARFEFPYSENIVVAEVASEKGHQSVKKYCEQMLRDANRRGLAMTGMLSLSILDRLKG